MKKSRFTESQIMGILRQAEGGVPVLELCREPWQRATRLVLGGAVRSLDHTAAGAPGFLPNAYDHYRRAFIGARTKKP
jgi:putative transposase